MSRKNGPQGDRAAHQFFLGRKDAAEERKGGVEWSVNEGGWL
jgi:hypothetical protein